MAGKNFSKGRDYAVEVELTDEQWLAIEHLFPAACTSPKGGRPTIAARACLEGIVRILRTWAQWKKLPKQFGPATTCWRRRDWQASGVLLQAWRALDWDLELLDGLDWSEGGRRCDVCPGRKRGDQVGVTKIGKGTKVQLVCDGNGLPVGVTIAAANVPETDLIEPSLDAIVVDCSDPEHLLFDKAADSDALRERLEARGIELVTAHHRNRRRAARQDGRALRRYRRRFKIERLIQRLKTFRRLRVRYDYRSAVFAGFVQLACLLILLREFV